jgi:hypothetical protein
MMPYSMDLMNEKAMVMRMTTGCWKIVRIFSLCDMLRLSMGREGREGNSSLQLLIVSL